MVICRANKGKLEYRVITLVKRFDRFRIGLRCFKVRFKWKVKNTDKFWNLNGLFHTSNYFSS